MSSHSLSLSKDKIRVLLLEGVNDSAVQLFVDAGYTNLERLKKALDGAALISALDGVHIVGIRSRTQLTEPVFAAANRLMAVGCFSVGTNQVELEAARIRGIPVFNAPFSNTRSVAELVIGEIVMLLRRITSRSEAAHAGRWDKSAERKASRCAARRWASSATAASAASSATLAEAMGMRVIYHDVTDKLRHGNTEPAAQRWHELLGGNPMWSACMCPRRRPRLNMIGGGGDRGDAARRLSDQQQPGHGRGPGRAGRGVHARRGI